MHGLHGTSDFSHKHDTAAVDATGRAPAAGRSQSWSFPRPPHVQIMIRIQVATLEVCCLHVLTPARARSNFNFKSQVCCLHVRWHSSQKHCNAALVPARCALHLQAHTPPYPPRHQPPFTHIRCACSNLVFKDRCSNAGRSDRENPRQTSRCYLTSECCRHHPACMSTSEQKPHRP